MMNNNLIIAIAAIALTIGEMIVFGSNFAFWGVVLLIVWYNRKRIASKVKSLGSSKSKENGESAKKTDGKVPFRKHAGLIINPLWLNFFWRPVLSAAIGGFATMLIWHGFSLEYSNQALFWGVALLLSTVLGSTWQEETVTIPKTKFAILSVLGMRISVYFSEGRYHWSLKKAGVHIERDGSEERSAALDKSGFLHRNAFAFRVWNDANKTESENPDYSILSTASNGAEVRSNVTANTRFFNAKLWQNHDDPDQYLGDTLRDAHRASVRFFSDKDAPKLGKVFDHLLMQRIILVAFRTDTKAVVRDRADNPLYMHIEAKEETNLEQYKDVFREKLAKEGAEEYLDKVHKIEGKYEVHVRSVRNILHHPLETLGIYFEGVKVSDAIPSEEVRKQANRASGEDYQLEGQMKSANAFVKSSLKRKEAAAAGVSEFDRAVAAAEDNPDAVQVAHISSGSNKLTEAAAAHAMLSKNGKGAKK